MRHQTNAMDTSACDDLKAFERRFTEVVSYYKPATCRWRSKYFWQLLFSHFSAFIRFLIVVLAVMSICTAISAFYWLRDPLTASVPLTESLVKHPAFTLATIVLLLLFLLGIHKLVIAPQTITSRMRLVLSDFNMSCDDTGKLILKPRPNNH